MQRSEFILQCAIHLSDQIPAGSDPKNYVQLVGRPCPSQYSNPAAWIQWWAEAEAQCKAIAAEALANQLGYLLKD